jgi:hypothetical protein
LLHTSWPPVPHHDVWRGARVNSRSILLQTDFWKTHTTTKKQEAAPQASSRNSKSMVQQRQHSTQLGCGHSRHARPTPTNLNTMASTPHPPELWINECVSHTETDKIAKLCTWLFVVVCDADTQNYSEPNRNPNKQTYIYTKLCIGTLRCHASHPARAGEIFPMLQKSFTHFELRSCRLSTIRYSRIARLATQ